ncbi:MAG: transposase family protein [Bacteroidales bacterium]|nr:transposase family protein [Bacteroidales bacterium]
MNTRTKGSIQFLVGIIINFFNFGRNCVGKTSVLEESCQQDKHGTPEIINSDQGSQYTSFAWTNYPENQGKRISMDGKGRATDNIWIERFWKSIKYDYIYLNPSDNGMELFAGVQKQLNIITRKNINQQRKSPMKRITNQSLKKQPKTKKCLT